MLKKLRELRLRAPQRNIDSYLSYRDDIPHEVHTEYWRLFRQARARGEGVAFIKATAHLRELAEAAELGCGCEFKENSFGTVEAPSRKTLLEGNSI